MRKLTPQEKKALSYGRDRRNTYHANDKASRRLIPLRKAQVNRNYRRRVGEILADICGQNLEGADILESRTRDITRTDWKKMPDAPLGEVVKRKLKRRVDHAGHGKTALKKAAEFLKSLKFKTEQEIDGRWIAEAVGMNGVLVHGDSRVAAVRKCRHHAYFIFLEQLGAIEILDIGNEVTSVLSK